MESLIFRKTARTEDMANVSFRNGLKLRHAAQTFRALPAYSELHTVLQQVQTQL